MAQGFLAPDDASALQDQLVRTQADLNELRALNPDWALEVNSVIDAVNSAEPDAARQAFSNLRELNADRLVELRVEEARLNHAEATLLYTFEVSKAGPLLCAAAYLADWDFSYWIDCGEARIGIGDLKAAQAAFGKASGLTAEKPNGRNAMIARFWIGGVQMRQGELSPALQAYQSRMNIARDLAARDPGNAGWARDVWVGLWRMARIDTENAAQHWAEVVARIEDTQARGILLQSDEPYLEQALENVSAIQQKGATNPASIGVLETAIGAKSSLIYARSCPTNGE